MKPRFSENFWADRGDAAHGHSLVSLRSAEQIEKEPSGEGQGLLSFAPSRIDWAGRPIRLYVPEHYEANYPYPLIVWLHGGGGNERELLTAMPMISQRNYLGVSFRGTSVAADRKLGEYHWSADADDLADFEAGLFETVCGLRREFHIHSERVFLVGFDEGATVALDLMLRRPECYGGAICLAGRFPQSGRSLAKFHDLRNKRVLIATGSGDSISTPADNVQAGRLLHAAGMSVSTRIVDAEHEVTRPMLRQIDHWIMDGICAAQ